MAVKVCGTVLSSLLYDNGNSKTDQEGLLLGKVINKRTNTISDSQISAVKEENFTYIYSSIPCGSGLSWYDNAGRVDIDCLKQILAGRSPKDVVGWYKFRRNTPLVVSLRERCVHRHLRETFPGVSDAQFVFMLCGVQRSANCSTYCLDHVFLCNTAQTFRAQQAEVINLGDTSHNEYKMKSSVTVDTGAGDFVSTINNTCKELMGKGQAFASDSNLIALQNSISTKIKSLGAEVSSTEITLGQLRTEIDLLQSKVKLKEDHLKSTFIPVPVSPPTSPGVRESIPRRQTSRVSLGDSYQQNRLSTSSTSPTTRKMSETEPDNAPQWSFDLEQGVTRDDNTESTVASVTSSDFVELTLGSMPKDNKKYRTTAYTVIEDNDSMETDESPDLINLNEEPSVHRPQQQQRNMAPRFMDSTDISDLDCSQNSESILQTTNPFMTGTTPEQNAEGTEGYASRNPFHMMSPNVPLSNNNTGKLKLGGVTPISTSSPAKKVKEDLFLGFCDNMKSSIRPSKKSTANTTTTKADNSVNAGLRTKAKGQSDWGVGMEGDVSPRITRSRTGALKKTEKSDNVVDAVSEESVQDDILCETMDQSDDISNSPVF